MLDIFVVDHDSVVDAAVGQGKTTYQFALDKLYPLIDRLGLQRKVQDPKFYDRLKRDLISGCVMPPITIAFVDEGQTDIDQLDHDQLQKYVNENIESGFILDGIQRLNTLHRAAGETAANVLGDRPLYFTVLICRSMDNLLYRMITLNNGQRPMTTRHQIEILTANLFEFSDSPLPIKTEKGNSRRRGTFKQADFVLAYLAFLSNSTAIDNQKLIEEKLDELLAFKILETDLTKSSVQFQEVLSLVDRFVTDEYLKSWFKNANNLIGFCSAVRKSYPSLEHFSNEDFGPVVVEFEKAFSSFSVSKIRLGQARRNAVSLFITQIEQFKDFNHLEMMEKMAAVI